GANVASYIRSGKRLARRVTEIVVQFKRAPFVLFRQTAVDKLEPNRLVLQLQPEEGISLSFGAKFPGPVVRLGAVNMAFNYADYFDAMPQTRYERPLYGGNPGGPPPLPGPGLGETRGESGAAAHES